MKLKLLNTYINFDNVLFMKPSLSYNEGFRQQIKVYFNGREEPVNFNFGEAFPIEEEAIQAAIETIDKLMLTGVAE